MTESGRLARPGHGAWSPGVLSDSQIIHLCENHRMIEPFERTPVREQQVRVDAQTHHETMVRKVISYGVGHYGYDIRVSDEFKVFTPAWNKAGEAVVDPKRLDPACMVAFKGEVCRIPPNSFALARSVERFNMPRDILGVVLGKSTYARCGLVVNCTPLEPEWRGWLTIEISNTTPLPAMVYANEGIAQVLFFKASQECAVSYADKGGGGKYQDQPEQIVLPRM